MTTVFCIGKSYAAHAAEMGDAPVPDDEPVVFLKPAQARLAPPGPIRLPAGAHEIHHEAEVVVRVGEDGRAEAVALGLDLTDRARQRRAKEAGLPWARAKGFRGAAPLGPFVPVAEVPALDRLRFTLRVDGEIRQRGDTGRLLWPIPALLADLDAHFALARGDLVFTGTPEGVGPIASGQHLVLELEGVAAATAHFDVA